MKLRDVVETAINPAFELLPAKMDSAAARIQLLAIGLQESRFIHRQQIGGPAHGFWQFERGGGVRGVLTHASSSKHAFKVCEARGVRPNSQDVYISLVDDDVLAAAFARLLLWTDPHKIPSPGNSEAAWQLYLRTWRPGKPHPHTWPDLYKQAYNEVMNVNS